MPTMFRIPIFNDLQIFKIALFQGFGIRTLVYVSNLENRLRRTRFIALIEVFDRFTTFLVPLLLITLISGI